MFILVQTAIRWSHLWSKHPNIIILVVIFFNVQYPTVYNQTLLVILPTETHECFMLSCYTESVIIIITLLFHVSFGATVSWVNKNPCLGATALYLHQLLWPSPSCLNSAGSLPTLDQSSGTGTWVGRCYWVHAAQQTGPSGYHIWPLTLWRCACRWDISSHKYT